MLRGLGFLAILFSLLLPAQAPKQPKVQPGPSEPDWIAILDAMTEADRADADRIDTTARQRIATAAGTTPADVDALLERFTQVRGVMRDMANMTFWQRLKLLFGARFRRPAPPE